MKWWGLVVGLVMVGGACGDVSAPAAGDAAARAAPPATTDAAATPARLDAAADRTAAADAGGVDRPAPSPTWTAIYGQLLVNASYPSNCMGGGCHDPGVEKGIDLSTREKGWSSIQKRLKPGAPQSSELIMDLQSGYMPRDKPQMPAADVALIRAWVQAGAQDD